jgi:hypothetical protein
MPLVDEFEKYVRQKIMSSRIYLRFIRPTVTLISYMRNYGESGMKDHLPIMRTSGFLLFFYELIENPSKSRRYRPLCKDVAESGGIGGGVRPLILGNNGELR